ncbi:heterotrimeric G-protein [Lithospermum erythrorhizon]|uniref:Heterotrimeric G-protein n=1 Tax=Lithospermum erythrorhizon TaxID=34254 RepID=A0AAV3QDB4_LITER
MMRFFNRAEPPSPSPSLSTASDNSTTSISLPSSPIVAGPARPIRFVYCDDKGKFQIDPEALAVLQLVKDPVGVVSVCGRARQGKSYILNQLLGQSSGFQVASTHRPCTKGLWLWSAPLKRKALDGTEFNLLLLDTEGIDAFDQTGTYSTQIFSLAVLLSSMFIYNQMGGIDETALDRLSLVTEMTKHIRVRASGGKTTASELGQFSPIFVWLLRDFYLDLVEENKRITPRDYLELALRPVEGGASNVAAKNEIRESIRALFPDRECFPLVRPLSDENDLQRLDQISLNRLRPEFKSGLDALTKFVFERTRPKQVGATIMTGPILARITQSFLDAINKGAVPTITSSWQSVEESECQRAYELATEVYISSFDQTKLPEEAALREAHEDAVQKALAIFKDTAVGFGSTRQKYESRMQKFVKKAFEDIKRDAFREAHLQCLNAVQKMEKELRVACQSPNAKVDSILKFLDGLLTNYEASCHGPEKWQKLAVFLQQSLEGPILDVIKKQADHIGSEKTSLELKCRSIEDRMSLLQKQLEASEMNKSEYLKRYEDAVSDKKRLADDYTTRIMNLQSKSSSYEERCSSLSKTWENVKQESLEWKRKYEQLLSKLKADEDQFSSEIGILKSRASAAEARLDAAKEHVHSAQEEAVEWKRKYDIACREAKNALEKAAAVQERSNKQTQLREDDLRAEFATTLSKKDETLRDKALKLEQAEQHLAMLSLELKGAKSRIESYDAESSALKLEIKELGDRLESTKATAQHFEQEAKIMEQNKHHLQQEYLAKLNRFEELQERCKSAEIEAKRATELADKARAEASVSQREKSDIQRTSMERLAQIERAERLVEKLQREKEDLANEVDRYREGEMDALSKVSMLQSRVQEREKEIDSLLKENSEKRQESVNTLETLLESERQARADANKRAEALSIKLQSIQAKYDSLQQELLDSKLRTASHGKRPRVEDHEIGVESVHDKDMHDKVVRGSKRSKSTSSPFKLATPEDGGSTFRGDDDSHSQHTSPGHSQHTSPGGYTKFTVQKLKQELTKHNFGDELLRLKNPTKKDIIALYEKCVLQKL